MAGLLARIGGSGRGLEYRVFDAYSKVAGAMLAARSTPDSFRDGTLFVRTTSAALAHEITLLRADSGGPHDGRARSGAGARHSNPGRCHGWGGTPLNEPEGAR